MNQLGVSISMLMMMVGCGGAGLNNRFSSLNYRQLFPLKPEPSMTQGSTCQHPDEYRYPEHIKYCKRDVATRLKYQIIEDYDATFGYRIGSMNRQDFKIDHYIPLCMGGSNRKNNLWPQHKSVYRLTDPMEQRSCELLAKGRLAQQQAIHYIREGKNDLSKVDDILEALNSL